MICPPNAKIHIHPVSVTLPRSIIHTTPFMFDYVPLSHPAPSSIHSTFIIAHCSRFHHRNENILSVGLILASSAYTPFKRSGRVKLAAQLLWPHTAVSDADEPFYYRTFFLGWLSCHSSVAFSSWNWKAIPMNEWMAGNQIQIQFIDNMNQKRIFVWFSWRNSAASTI